MSPLKLFFIINAGLFLIVGLRALLSPVASVAEPFGLKVLDVDGMNYLRSGTGGVSTLAGFVLALALWIPALQFPAVVMFTTMLAGLVGGRLYSIAVDGAPGMVPWVSGFFELLGVVFGLYWLTVLWPAAVTP